MGDQKSKSQKRDAVLRTMLRTPPDPHEPKAKRHPYQRRGAKALEEAQKAFGDDASNWTVNSGKVPK
jgi:hypothetical protein